MALLSRQLRHGLATLLTRPRFLWHRPRRHPVVTARRQRLPLLPKLAYTLMVAAVVPCYLVYYGWRNLLWFSDIALIALAFALWLEHRLTVSAVAVGTLLFELAWTLDFGFALVFGGSPIGLASYMFDASIPLFLGMLSLFHLALPPLVAWLLYRLGYDRRAFWLATGVTAALLPATWLLTEPDDNVNWVYGVAKPQGAVAQPTYVGLLTAALPIAVFRPTHRLLMRLFGH